METGEAAYRSHEVCHKLRMTMSSYLCLSRVLNTIKTMVTDEDILEADDMFILVRMKEFVFSPDVVQIPAAKNLVTLIQRAVRFFVSPVKQDTDGLTANWRCCPQNHRIGTQLPTTFDHPEDRKREKAEATRYRPLGDGSATDDPRKPLVQQN